MRETRMNSFGARFLQRARNFRERPTGVAHVVNNQTTAAANIADDVHYFGNVGLLTTFVTKSKFRIEALRISASALGAAGVRSHDRQVRQRMFLIVTDKDRRSIK